MVDGVEFGGGECTVRPATKEDVRELNDCMRQADRDEIAAFGFDYDDCESSDQAWAVRIGGDLVCVMGIAKLYANETHLSKTRQFFLLSTDKVWRHKVAYVRYSSPVMLWVLNRMPSWVDCVRSIPMLAYEGSVRWQERVLGFRAIGAIMINGVEHLLMEKRRGGAHGVG